MEYTVLQSIMPEFREPDLAALLEANPLGDLRYREFFPSEFKTGLTFGNLEGETGAKVIAPIVAMDSDVVLKGRDNTEAIKGEIPKVEVGRKKTERDFFRLQELRNSVALNPRNANIKTQLINKIYEDAIFVTDSVNASMEFMAKSLLSQGFYQANGVKIDFGVTVQNSTDDWFDPAKASTFDPIKELQSSKTSFSKRFQIP